MKEIFYVNIYENEPKSLYINVIFSKKKFNNSLGWNSFNNKRFIEMITMIINKNAKII